MRCWQIVFGSINRYYLNCNMNVKGNRKLESMSYMYVMKILFLVIRYFTHKDRVRVTLAMM